MRDRNERHLSLLKISAPLFDSSNSIRSIYKLLIHMYTIMTLSAKRLQIDSASDTKQNSLWIVDR